MKKVKKNHLLKAVAMGAVLAKAGMGMEKYTPPDPNGMPVKSKEKIVPISATQAKELFPNVYNFIVRQADQPVFIPWLENGAGNMSGSRPPEEVMGYFIGHRAKYRRNILAEIKKRESWPLGGLNHSPQPKHILLERIKGGSSYQNVIERGIEAVLVRNLENEQMKIKRSLYAHEIGKIYYNTCFEHGDHTMDFCDTLYTISSRVKHPLEGLKSPLPGRYLLREKIRELKPSLYRKITQAGEEGVFLSNLENRQKEEGRVLSDPEIKKVLNDTLLTFLHKWKFGDVLSAIGKRSNQPLEGLKPSLQGKYLLLERLGNLEPSLRAIITKRGVEALVLRNLEHKQQKESKVLTDPEIKRVLGDTLTEMYALKLKFNAVAHQLKFKDLLSDIRNRRDEPLKGLKPPLITDEIYELIKKTFEQHLYQEISHRPNFAPTLEKIKERVGNPLQGLKSSLYVRVAKEGKEQAVFQKVVVPHLLQKLNNRVHKRDELRRQLLRQPRTIDLSLKPVGDVLDFLQKAKVWSSEEDFVKVKLTLLNVTQDQVQSILDDENSNHIEELEWLYRRHDGEERVEEGAAPQKGKWIGEDAPRLPNAKRSAARRRDFDFPLLSELMDFEKVDGLEPLSPRAANTPPANLKPSEEQPGPVLASWKITPAQKEALPKNPESAPYPNMNAHHSSHNLVRLYCRRAADMERGR